MIDKDILNCKLSEYTGKAMVALILHDDGRFKRMTGTMLGIYRLQARAALDQMREAWKMYRKADNAVKRAAKAGIRSPVMEEQLIILRDESEAAKHKVVQLGADISRVLDLWQRYGATPRELCDLCNRDYESVLQEVGPDLLNEDFSKLACVYNLDYKNPRDKGFLEDTVDAPLTHTLKEYLIDLMLNTDRGRAAAHEAMNAVFPGIMENTMRLITDADGVQHFVDGDGVEVGTIEEAD